jgi:sensor histidine kinase regulating citrate/malate metabolism
VAIYVEPDATLGTIGTRIADMSFATAAERDRCQHASGQGSRQPRRRGAMVAIVVADTGKGMTPEFVPATGCSLPETTKSSDGIGVYESVQYVSSIGGEIAIESNLAWERRSRYVCPQRRRRTNAVDSAPEGRMTNA